MHLAFPSSVTQFKQQTWGSQRYSGTGEAQPPMFRTLAITATLLGLASTAQADVYRWTGADGTVQYSDRWVPGSVLIKTDKSHPSPVPSAPAPAPAARAGEVVSQQRDQRVVQQDVAKAKADQCKQAREAYDKAVQSRRIYKEGPNGTREYVSDADADAYRLGLLNARKQVCGS